MVRQRISATLLDSFSGLHNNAANEAPASRGGEVHVSTTYEWQQLYHVAILETDGSKLDVRIQAVESAINLRLKEFAVDHGGTPEENLAIADAMNGLKVLRKDAAAWRERAGSS